MRGVDAGELAALDIQRAGAFGERTQLVVHHHATVGFGPRRAWL